MAVFVLDRNGNALMRCTEKRSRLLLERSWTRVSRLMHFVIRLVDRQADTKEQAVLNLFELMHRGRQISEDHFPIPSLNLPSRSCADVAPPLSGLICVFAGAFDD